MKHKTIDARKLHCPQQILQAKPVIEKMAAGEVVKVIATDPDSVKDFQVFSQRYSCEIIESSQLGKEFHYVLKKLD